MRLAFEDVLYVAAIGFNRRREASPRATYFLEYHLYFDDKFQSQTRSQSQCDNSSKAIPIDGMGVSIADAKPVPVRQGGREASGEIMTVSIADAKPVPVRRPPSVSRGISDGRFQSQTRSQSPCDQ